MNRNPNQINRQADLRNPNKPLQHLSESLGLPVNQSSPQEAVIQEKKLFIKNLDKSVTDSLMNNLLRVLGDIKSWKRTQNEKGEPVSFGCVEFKEMTGVLNCIRIFNNYSLSDKQIEVILGKKTKISMANYLEYKTRKLAEDHPSATENEINERLIASFSADDDKIKEKLSLIIDKFFDNREKIVKTGPLVNQARAEKKLHDQKKKYGLVNEDDLRTMYEEALKVWLRRERRYKERKEDEYKESKDLHLKKERMIERELKFDDFEEERKLDSKDYRRNVERRREKRWKQYRDDLKLEGKKTERIEIEVSTLKKRGIEEVSMPEEQSRKVKSKSRSKSKTKSLEKTIPINKRGFQDVKLETNNSKEKPLIQINIEGLAPVSQNNTKKEKFDLSEDEEVNQQQQKKQFNPLQEIEKKQEKIAMTIERTEENLIK